MSRCKYLGNSYNQFKTYLSSISSMDELKYIYDAKKIPGNATEAEAYMKDKFKNLFSIPQKQTEIFDIIWANQNLRGSLFGGRTESVARTYFSSLIDSESPILYDFIKVE